MDEKETVAAPEDVAAGGAPPPFDFSSFVLSLSTSALVNMGLIESPVTGKTEKELASAQQTIDLIALLQEKTKGNLTGDESRLMEDVLHELRLLYLKASA